MEGFASASLTLMLLLFTSVVILSFFDQYFWNILEMYKE